MYMPTQRELATILYALHRYQSVEIDTPNQLEALSAAGFEPTHFHTHTPLNPDEVDVLCLKLTAVPEVLYAKTITGDDLDDFSMKVLDRGAGYLHGIIRSPGETDADLRARVMESMAGQPGTRIMMIEEPPHGNS